MKRFRVSLNEISSASLELHHAIRGNIESAYDHREGRVTARTRCILPLGALLVKHTVTAVLTADLVTTLERNTR